MSDKPKEGVIGFLKQWFKELRCLDHYWYHERNIYGDEINYAGCRSIWKCKFCSKIKLSDELYRAEDSNE